MSSQIHLRLSILQSHTELGQRAGQWKYLGITVLRHYVSMGGKVREWRRACRCTGEKYEKKGMRNSIFFISFSLDQASNYEICK